MSAQHSIRGPVKFVGLLDTVFQRLLGAVCVGLLLVMLAAVGGQVFMRYALNSPLSWSEELARFSMVWLAMIGSALCARHGQHIALSDLVPLRPRAKIVANALILVLVGGVLAILVYHSWDLVGRSARQTTSGLGVSMSYIYAAIPVGAALMIAGLVLGWIDAALQVRASRAKAVSAGS